MQEGKIKKQRRATEATTSAVLRAYATDDRLCISEAYKCKVHCVEIKV